MSVNENLKSDYGIVLKDHEVIKWFGKPHRLAYILNEIKNLLLSALVFLFFIAIMFGIYYWAEQEPMSRGTMFAYAAFCLFALLSFVKQVYEARNIVYVITNLRVFIYQKKVLKTELDIVKLEEVITKKLKKSFVEERYKTGTIEIFTGATIENDGSTEKVFDYIQSVENPEDIMDLLD